MKQTVSIEMFIKGFKESSYKDAFSVEGLGALYDYLVDIEESAGQEIEFDVVALACDFTEYDDLGDLINDYLSDGEDIESWEDAIDELLEYTVALPIYKNGEVVGVIVERY